MTRTLQCKLRRTLGRVINHVAVVTTRIVIQSALKLPFSLHIKVCHVQMKRASLLAENGKCVMARQEISLVINFCAGGAANCKKQQNKVMHVLKKNQIPSRLFRATS